MTDELSDTARLNEEPTHNGSEFPGELPVAAGRTCKAVKKALA